MADYVILSSVAVIVGTVIILGLFLSRYRMLAKQADESSRLAKDVWDSMNSRFMVLDARIIDLMARTEVLSAQSISSRGQSESIVAPPLEVPSVPTEREELKFSLSPKIIMQEVSQPGMGVVKAPPSVTEGTETEARVLQLLLEGPKTSAQIKEGVGRSREHTARLMKLLFDKGLVVRNSRNKPYVYEVTENGKSYLGSWSTGK